MRVVPNMCCVLDMMPIKWMKIIIQALLRFARLLMVFLEILHCLFLCCTNLVKLYLGLGTLVYAWKKQMYTMEGDFLAPNL